MKKHTVHRTLLYIFGKNQWVFAISSASFAMAGLASVMYFAYTEEMPSWFLTVVVGIALLVLSSSLLSYLKGSSTGKNIREDYESLGRGLMSMRAMLQEVLGTRGSGLLHQIKKMEKMAKGIPEARIVFTDEEKASIVESLKTRLDDSLTETFIETLDSKYVSLIEKSTFLNATRAQFASTQSRLKDEIESLTNRGNLNLVIGIVTTLFAMGLLAYIVMNTTISASEWQSSMPSILLRLTLVIFIEIFSFFFLRLYKSSLQEIKYFQNELTNVEVKYIALEMAIAGGSADAINGIISELGRVERNFVLKKGESTVELEKLRSDGQSMKDVIEALQTITKNSK